MLVPDGLLSIVSPTLLSGTLSSPLSQTARGALKTGVAVRVQVARKSLVKTANIHD